jgi:hypothetical protein
MGDDDADMNTTQRIFAIFVEQMQNIMHYSAECDPCESDLRSGVVLVSNTKDKFTVICGNKIESRHEEHIKERLQQIQSMDKSELKVLYKDLRRKDPVEGSLGAGLGLVDMARRASEPLEYKFMPLDDKYSFFSIKVVG